MMLRSSTARLLTAIVVAVVGVSTIALVQGQGGTITACVSQSNGVVKIASARRSCPAGSTVLQWNQEGPPGPPGPSGLSNCSVHERRYVSRYQRGSAFLPPGHRCHRRWRIQPLG